MSFLSNLASSLFDPGKAAREQAQNMAQSAQLAPFSLSGPGGASFNYSPSGGSISLGNLGPLRDALIQAVGGNLAQGATGVPSYLTNAAGGATGALSAPGPVAGGIDPGFLQALQGISGADLGSSASTLASIPGTADAVRQQQLDLMRQQAQPYEKQFVNNQLNDLFSKGRFGQNDSQSSLVARGIGEALTNADLQRQIQAQDLGNQTQQDMLSQALGLQSAGNTGLNNAQGMYGNMFQNALQGAQYNAGNAVNRFNIANTLFGSTLNNQNTAMQRALSGLGGIQNMDTSGLQNFTTALEAAIGKSNAQLGGSKLLLGASQATPNSNLDLLKLIGGAAMGAGGGGGIAGAASGGLGAL